MAIGCPDCGAVQDLPPMPPWSIASCRRCGSPLERTGARSIELALAASFSVLSLLIAANLLPCLSVGDLGLHREVSLWSAIPLLLREDWVLIALGIAALVVALPLLRFALLTVTLGAVHFGWRPRWLGTAFRWAVELDLWSMPDVLLLGALIGYLRVSDKLPVAIDAGGWCFLAAAALTMVARGALDRRTVWRAISADHDHPASDATISCTVCDLVVDASAEGQRCRRCGNRLHARKPDALVRAGALTVAGIVLYPMANIWPMTLVSQLGQTNGRTIFYGIHRLADAGLWPFAIVIFITSVTIPLLKLFAIGWFLLAIRYRWRWALKLRTSLHRNIDALGRWSNVDVMIVTVIAPLMQFQPLAHVSFGIGAACFFAVVMFTMFASRAFDPRLMWDAAEAAEAAP